MNLTLYPALAQVQLVGNTTRNLNLMFLITCLFASALALVSDANDLKLSLQEKNALESFKKDVMHFLPEDFMKTDFYLIRWIRTTHMDLRGARNRLMHTLDWRKQNNMTGSLLEDWTDISEECPMTFDGYDKESRPVRSLDGGLCDIRKLNLQGRAKRILRYFQYANEKQMQMIFKMHEETGKPVTRFILLLDATGLNLRQHVSCAGCLSTLMQWFTLSDMHYPEFLGEVVVINAPSAVAVAMTAIRPLMSQDIRDRIQIFDSNNKAWMKYLDSRIDRNQRRERYGGTIKE